MVLGKLLYIGALLYAANASPANASKENLTPLNLADKSQVIKLMNKDNSMSSGMLNVRSVGLTDLVQQDFKKLEPNTSYTLALTNSSNDTFNADYVINSFKTDEKGAFSGQSSGIIKSVGTGGADYKHVVLIDDLSKKLVMISN